MFQTLNADLASQVTACYFNRTLLELVSTTTPNTAISDMDELLLTLGSLKKQDGPTVFYIFDEHNELYKPTSTGLSPIDIFSTILGDFTRWTGNTSGVCLTMIIN